MTDSASSSASVPPGWYPHPTSGENTWWDGSNWMDAAAVQEIEKRRGTLLLEISRKAPNPTLRVYDNEVWKVMPAGMPGSVGGPIAGARASVISLVPTDPAASRSLHVTAPAFEFNFEMLRKEQNALAHDQLAWAVEYINNRSRELAPSLPTGTSAGEKAAPAAHSVADELAKFAALRDQGILTEEEFAVKKAQLLA